MIDETARRAELIAATRATLADLFDRHERVFMAFSGGKDSLTLLHLCEPWRDRLTLVWSNTGHMAPHMVHFVRGHRDRFDLVEVEPTRPMADQWAEHGTPADILPLEHVEGIDWRSPRLQPWTACCGVHRVAPVLAHVEAHGDTCALLFGQRRTDGGGTVTGLSGALPARVEVAMPLWGWTTADVLAFVDAEGVQLAPHHAECPTSLECIVCPANLSAEKLRLLDRLHPEAAAGIRTRARHSLALAGAKATEILAVLDGTGLAAREVRR